MLVAFIITELIVKDPVMDLRIFANYTFTSANVLTWAVSAFLFGSLFLLPIFFEQVQGKSAFDTGLVLISQGLAAAVATLLTSRLYNRVGPRVLIAAGFVFITAGTYGFTQLAVGSSVLSLQGWLVLRGLGLGFTNIPLQTLVVSRISNRAMARASSLVNVTRQIFSAVGLSALTTYLLQRMSVYYASAAPAQLQAQIPAAACLQSDVVAKVPHLAQICASVVTSGMNDAFLVSMVGCAICVVLSLLVGSDPSIKTVREARKRGEAVPEPQPVMVVE
jgi:MFS family permease